MGRFSQQDNQQDGNEEDSNSIKLETEGGITIAHDGNENIQENKEGESESRPPLKIKIFPVEGKQHMVTSTVAQQPQQPQQQQNLKPKRKRRVRLTELYPSYIQDGFFGPDLLE